MQDKKITEMEYKEKRKCFSSVTPPQSVEDQFLHELYADFDIFVAKKHPNLGFRKHFHKALKLYYILQGQMVAEINGVSKLVRQGEIFIVNSFELHEYEKSEDSKVLVLIIGSHYYENFAMIYPGKIFQNFMEDISFNLRVLPLLETVYDRLDGLTELETIGYTDLILGKLVKGYGLKERKSSDEIIIKIIEYIYEHYQDNISIASVAKELNYAATSISRIFRNGVGVDFRVYVNNVRAEKAHQMLMDAKNGDNMTQIAIKNGFNSMASFYRAYKRKFGHLPRRH